MQVLGKRSKIMLIVVVVVMLVAVGVSFAIWDLNAVKATNENLSTYANAKVGDVIEFGRYYQTGKRVNNDENGEYEKTPIEWIVVDKDERTGQLTLMSKFILAAGSYFGNYYYDNEDKEGSHYDNNLAICSIPYNQAYVESTARAFLNNLERRDIGGDTYSSIDGYKTSITPSVTSNKLYTSVGFSNKIYTFTDEYKRQISNIEYRNRPATRGFYDEAFTDEQKSMILPKVIPGYIGHRWPNNSNDPTKMSYIEGTIDKVWLPSATELNSMSVNDEHTNPSDDAGAKVFEYFKNYGKYNNHFMDKLNSSLSEALKTKRSEFVKVDSKSMNYSIPVYKYQSTDINNEISTTANSADWYWTRSPMSINYGNVRYVTSSGSFSDYRTYRSYGGVRPCVILKY